MLRHQRSCDRRSCDLTFVPRDFSRATNQPTTEARGIVRRNSLPDQRGTDPGEDVAHAAARHSRVASRVEFDRVTGGCYGRSGAFVQQRHPDRKAHV